MSRTGAFARRRYLRGGAELSVKAAAPNTPEQFTAFARAEVVKWAKVVKDSGATAD